MSYLLNNSLSSFAMTALAATISSLSTVAQAQEELMLEEVVVTANRRESNLMETGISISAYNAEALDRLKIDDLNDLSINTPALSITSDQRITVRGVGQETITLGTDPGVATYLDGVYTRGTAFFQMNNFFDIERVEVLRGPQGTLYGRNTAGGAINLIRKKSTENFEAEINLEVGNEDYLATQSMINIPLSEKISWRTALSKIERGPLQENLVGTDIDELDNSTFDTTLEINWSEDWVTDIRINGYERKGRPESGYIPEEFDTTTRYYPGAINVNAGYKIANQNPGAEDISVTRRDFDNTIDEDYTGFALTNTVTVGDIDIKYIGAYGEFELDRALDADRSDSTLASYVQDVRADGEYESHELQFISDFEGSVNFIAGLYYSNSEENSYVGFRNIANDMYATDIDLTNPTTLVNIALAGSDTGDGTGRTLINANLPGTIFAADFPSYVGRADSTYFYADSSLRSESYAAFGQVDFDLSEQLTLTTGLRYSLDKKSAEEEVYVAFPLSEGTAGEFELSPGVFAVLESVDHINAGGGVDGASIAHMVNSTTNNSGSDDWDSVNGTVRLQYTTNEDNLLYASISNGYRSGGFSLGKGADTGLDNFDEENVTSFEVGYKATLLDNRLSYEASIYHYDYKDLQVLQQFIETDGTQGDEINNAADATITGLELQSTWLATERLTMTAAYAWMQAEFDEFITIDTASGSAVPEDVSGNNLSRTPENKVGLSATYTLPLGDSGDLAFTGIYSWIDEMYTDVFNSDNGKLDSWDRVDLVATWYVPGDAMTVSAFVKNVTDDREASDASRGTATDGFQRSQAMTDPRMYGVKFNYKF